MAAAAAAVAAAAAAAALRGVGENRKGATSRIVIQSPSFVRLLRALLVGNITFSLFIYFVL